jgi:hypothetical protein
MKYKVIDNFLEKKDFIKLKDTMCHPDFPWYYNDSVSKEGKKDSFYFTHLFYCDDGKESNWYYSIVPIIIKLKIKTLVRVKGNFYPKANKIIEHGKHVDADYKHKGFILYINTNDGFTRLKDGTKIKSIENRGLLFDPSIEHNSTTCTNQNGRININFNYF